MFYTIVDLQSGGLEVVAPAAFTMGPDLEAVAVEVPHPSELGDPTVAPPARPWRRRAGLALLAILAVLLVDLALVAPHGGAMTPRGLELFLDQVRKSRARPPTLIRVGAELTETDRARARGTRAQEDGSFKIDGEVTQEINGHGSVFHYVSLNALACEFGAARVGEDDDGDSLNFATLLKLRLQVPEPLNIEIGVNRWRGSLVLYDFGYDTLRAVSRNYINSGDSRCAPCPD